MAPELKHYLYGFNYNVSIVQTYPNTYPKNITKGGYWIDSTGVHSLLASNDI